MSKHPTNQNHKSSTSTTNLTESDVKEVVAETVEQLVTTSQEKPAVAAPEATVLPKYDAEYIKTLNVSGAVRYLFSLGFTRGQIVKEFPKARGRTILYQHVRNVLITPIKSSS